MLAACTALIFLGVSIPVREQRSRQSILFGLLSFTLAIWLGAFGMMYLSGDRQVALWWCRAAYLGIPFIPAAVYQFSVSFLGKHQQERFYVWLFWALSLFFAERFVTTDLFLEGVRRHWWGYYPFFTPAGMFFLGYSAVALLASMWHFLVEYRNQNVSLQRKRIRSFMLAFVIGSLAMLDAIPCFGISFYPIGWAPILLFAVLSSRAIHKYGLVTM